MHAGVHRVALGGLGRSALRSTAEAAVRRSTTLRVDEGEPDVVLTSGDRGAIAAAAGSGKQVVAVLPRADRRATTAALDAGASGIVLERDVTRSLPAVVAAVSCGLVAVPQATREAVRQPVLTDREEQVLSMIVIGLTNAEIAERLRIAESTVKSHLSAVFDKLGVRSRKEAAQLALDPGSSLGSGILALRVPRSSVSYTQPVVE